MSPDRQNQGEAPPQGGADPLADLYVKSRLDGSTFRASVRPVAGVPEGVPVYSSPEAAIKDRHFKGGYFRVQTALDPTLKTLSRAWIRDLYSSPPLPPQPSAPPASGPKDTNPKTVYGQAKPSLSLLPGPALALVAEAMREGQAKYGPMNWREDPVSFSTYADAGLRHLYQAIDGEDRCPQSGAYHLAHLAANALILLDAMQQGKLIDDRPPGGTMSRTIYELTRAIKGVVTNG